MSAVNPVYHLAMPATQFGAVKDRGTDMATHIVWSAIAFAALMSTSIFILYVDLTKAFARMLREYAMGMSEEAAANPIPHS